MKKLFILLSLSLLVSSCATQTFAVDPSVKREVPPGNPHFSKWSSFFVSGIGQNDFKNASKLCAESGGASFVEVRQSFAQGVVSVLTYGIYTPRTMNIYCNKN